MTRIEQFIEWLKDQEESSQGDVLNYLFEETNSAIDKFNRDMPSVPTKVYMIDPSRYEWEEMGEAPFLSDNDFIAVAKSQGLYWDTISDFQQDFNEDGISDQHFIRII